MRTFYFQRSSRYRYASFLGSVRLVLALVLTSSILQARDATPEVSLSFSQSSVTEGPQTTVTLAVTITEAQPNQSFEFAINLEGAGVVAEDFIDRPNNITLPSGMTEGTVDIVIADDNLIEGPEEVTASITSELDGVLLAPQHQASFTLNDNDFARLNLSSTETVKTEGGPTFNLGVELDLNGKTLASAVIVDLQFDVTNTAIGAFGESVNVQIPGQDFRAFPDNITFPNTAPHGSVQQIVFETFTDSIIEGEETANLLFSSSNGTLSSMPPLSHRLRIQDQNTPVIRFALSETEGPEGGPAETMTIELDLGSNTLATSLEFEVVSQENSTAVLESEATSPPADFRLSPQTIEFAAETISGATREISVAFLADQLVEGEEIADLGINLLSTGFPGFVPPSFHRMRVRDTNLATLEFSQAQTSVAEGDNPVNVEVQLNTGGAQLASPVQGTLEDLHSGQAIGSFDDYQELLAELSPPPLDSIDFGVTDPSFRFDVGDGDGSTRSISIESFSDQLVEGLEQAAIGLRINSGPVTVGTQSSHQYEIADANAATISFVETESLVSENQDDKLIELILETSGAFLAVPVQVTIGEKSTSTATGRLGESELTDFDYSISEPLVEFPAESGDQARMTFSVSPKTDQWLEGEEIGQLELSQLQGPARTGDNTEHNLKISDNNSATVSFQSSTSQTTEDSETHSVIAVIDTRGATLARSFDTPFQLNDQTASSPSDFELPQVLNITWPEETTTGQTQNITIPIIDDSLLELSESFQVELKSPSTPAGITAAGTHTVTIADDDSATVGLSVINGVGAEGGESPLIGLNISQISTTPTVVQISSSYGDGSPGPSGESTIPGGFDSQVIQIIVIDDDLVEGTETLNLHLDSITQGDADISIDELAQSVSVAIEDNDSTTVALGVEQHAAEDDQNGIFKLTLTKPVVVPLHFNLGLSGTATGNVDYTTPNLQLTIPAEETSLTLNIPTLADELDENDETIIATISGSNLPELPITLPEDSVQMLLQDNDDSPIANNDSGPGFTILEDQPLNPSSETGVLANDTDADDGNGPANLTAVLVEESGPAHAQSFNLNSNGSFTYQPTLNYHGSDSFTYRASDGTNRSEPATVTIQVTSVNDAPTHSAPTSRSVLEGGELTFSTQAENGIRVNDVDLSEGQLGVVINSQGLLTLATTNGLEFSSGDGFEDSSLTFFGSLTAVNAALDGLRYKAPTGVTSDSIQIRSNDQGASGEGGAQETQSSIAITIQPLNDPPTLELPTLSSLTAIGGGGAVLIASDLIVTDTDSPELASALVQIDSNFNPNQDQLTAGSLPAGIGAVFNSSTGSLELTGPASVSLFQSALRQVRYQNSSESPSTATRRITFQVNDGNLGSNTVGRDVTPTEPPRIPPSLNASQLGSRLFVEGGLPIGVIRNVRITPGSAGPILEAVVTISGFVPGEDHLETGLPTGLSRTFDSTSGTLRITGNASTSAFQSALASVVYRNSSDSPSTQTRTINFEVSDAEQSSSTVSVPVRVEARNDAPEIRFNSEGSLEFKVGDAPLGIFNTVGLSDADDNNLAALTALFGRGYDTEADRLEIPNLPAGLTSEGFQPSDGSLTVRGLAPLSVYRQAIQNLRYANDTTFQEDRQIGVSIGVADPAGANSNSQTQSIKLLGTSSPPLFEGIKNLEFPEDTKLFEFSFTVTDDKTKPDDIQLEFSLTSKAKLFDEQGVTLARDGQNATLSFTPLPNAYGAATVKLIATDGQNLTTETELTVTVTPVIDPLKIALDPLTPLVFRDGSGPRPLFDAVEILAPDALIEPVDGAEAPVEGEVNLEIKIEFDSGYQPQEDRLAARAPNPIEFGYETATGLLSLSGKATPKQFSAALQSITYANTSHTPRMSPRKLTISIRQLLDGQESPPQVFPLILEVFDVNLPPLGGNDQARLDGNASTIIPINTLLANDSDPDGDPVTISLVSAKTKLGGSVRRVGQNIIVNAASGSTPDYFFYTLSDQRGGYSAVRVNLIP